MWSLIFALIACTAYGSDKFAYPPQKVSLRGIKNIQIIGVRGNLKMSGRPSAHAMTMKIRQSTGRKSDDWHLEVQKRKHTLVLEVFSVSYGKQWRKIVARDQWPEFDIELDGPARPTVVAWREGTLQFQNWNASLEISFLKGTTEVSGGQGAVNMHPVEAQVSVHDHYGDVNIQGDAGAVKLTRNFGTLELNWLRGAISIVNSRGNMRVETQNSQFSVSGGGGNLNVHVEQGLARIASFLGHVDGRSGQAKWDLAESAPADVNVTTSTGPVGVHWKAGGAKVFLTSKRGPISFPASAFLRWDDRNGDRIVEGERRSKPMGQVFVRTESGRITWSNSLTD